MHVAVWAGAGLGGYPARLSRRHAQSRLNRGSGLRCYARSRGRRSGGWGKMMSWFWPDIPPAVLVCCWAGIRLWRVLARRDAELKAEHAGVAAQAVAVPVLLQPTPAAACGAGHLACGGVAERSGQGKPGFALRRLSGAGAYRSGFLPGGTPDTGAPSRRKPGSSPGGMRFQSASPPRPATVWSQSRRGSL